MKTIKKLKDLNIHSNSKVLVLMPHPDDETAATGGLISKLTSHDIKTKVVVFTKGEKSTLRFGLSNSQDLALTREKELQNAMKILNIDDYELFDYGDGKLKLQEKNLTNHIKQIISKFDPTHLLTLEPHGIYGHPDHIVLSKISTNLGQNLNIPILYATIFPGFTPSSGSASLSELDELKPIQPQFKLKLSFKHRLAKLRALIAHASQFRHTSRIKHLSSRLLFGKFSFEYYAYKN